MGSELFYWVLNMSIVGSVTGLLVLLLRRIRRIPRIAVYLMWVLPMIRLWVPIGIASSFSLLGIISHFTTRSVVVWKDHPNLTVTNTIMVADGYFPIHYPTPLIQKILGIAAAVWCIVAVAAILASLMLYIATKTELRRAVHLEGNLYSSDRVTTPAVYGILRPRILLPAAMFAGDEGRWIPSMGSMNRNCALDAKSSLDWIILHEQVHMKRRDNLWRVFAVVTACIHWFNPLVWVCLKRFFEDMELACDEGVLGQLDSPEDAREYAKTILACAEGMTFFAAAFGGARTRVRIESILSYRRLTVAATLSLLALLILLAFAMATNAVA